MSLNTKKEGGFEYYEDGEGPVAILLHGLMGTLSNFEECSQRLVDEGYRVLIPLLPVYELPLLKTSAKSISKFLEEFVQYKQLENLTIIGNSLGGHVALIYTKNNPESVKYLVLTGSSGLYEKAMGDTFPRREDYDYIRKKTEEVFYDPKIATKELVDDLFETVNNRDKVLRILALAKSAIRHNMSKDLPKMHTPTCLIWGKHDNVTPPEVAEEFHKLMPNSELFWIEKSGHAAMMECPLEFNEILMRWLKEKTA